MMFIFLVNFHDIHAFCPCPFQHIHHFIQAPPPPPAPPLVEEAIAHGGMIKGQALFDMLDVEILLYMLMYVVLVCIVAVILATCFDMFCIVFEMIGAS